MSIAAPGSVLPVPAAGASSLIDRNATKVKLQVNKDNVALISYHSSLGNVSRRVVAWALQSWARPAPNYGIKAKDKLSAATELRLSHWTGRYPY